MRISYIAIALAALFACSAVAPAAPKKKATTKHKTSKAKTAKAKPKAKIGAENGLVGIKLYDTGIVLLKKYGNPIEIQAVTIGSTSNPGSGGGGGGPRGAGPSGPGGPAGPSGGGPSGPGIAPGLESSRIGPASSSFDDLMFGYPPPAGGPAAAPPMGGGGGGAAGGGMTAPKGGGSGAPGGAVGGSTSATRTVFTRWVYRRPTGRYAFILDKFNHVVQIEAVGLTDAKVRTARGIGFGASFKTIVEKYGAPDAYEIAGSSLVIRYLVKHKVAFRLNRLGEDKPHVVTGIVVAAGKS